MNHPEVVHLKRDVLKTATGDPAYQQPAALPEPSPEDVERVRKNWGEDLNTAFQYEKYKDSATGGEWASSAVRFEWQESFEEAVAPRDEMLEKELFGEESHIHSGINFSNSRILRTWILVKTGTPVSA